MKKFIRIFIVPLMLILCVFTFVGCAEVSVYGKTFTFKDKYNIGHHTLDHSYGKKTEDVINNLMSNFDWSNCYFDNVKIDVSDKNFTNASQVLDYFQEEYAKIVKPKLEGVELKFGSEEEKNVTISKNGEETLVYNLKPSVVFGEGFLDGYWVEDGVEHKEVGFTLSELTDESELYITGANYEVELKLGFKTPVKDYDEGYVDFMTILIAILYSV